MLMLMLSSLLHKPNALFCCLLANKASFNVTSLLLFAYIIMWVKSSCQLLLFLLLSSLRS